MLWLGRRADGILERLPAICCYPEMNYGPNTAKLAILRCPECNAPVPLGDANDVVCRYCAVTFPVPDTYRALRDAEGQKTSERDEARTLYGRLGRPPGTFAQMWGSVAVGCVWIFLWPLALVADALLIARGLEIVSRSIHATLFDVLPNTVVWTGIGVALYASLAVPLALGVYGNRRTNGRRRLQAALAALPPDREGGPARCHSCNAPLDVGPSDLGLACVYCGADNLVRMPETWVASLREKATRLDRRIEAIGHEDREMRSKERTRLRRQLGWLLIFIPLIATFGIIADRSEDAYPPSWRAAVASQRELIPATRNVVDNYDKYIPAPLAADGSLGRFAYDKSERGKGYFMRSYYVPLRYRETVRLTAGDFPVGARALGFTFRTQVSAVFGDVWQQIGRDVILYPNDTATFEAPRSAWYRVDVMLIDDVAAGKQFQLGIAVSPPAQ